MRIPRKLLIIILLLIAFLPARPIEDIADIKTNSIRVKTNQVVNAPGMYLNETGTIAAINLFIKYQNLDSIVATGAKLITNIETQIVYRDRIVTNTVKLDNNEIDLFKIEVKREKNRTLGIDGGALVVGIIGGVLIPQDNAAVSRVGFGMMGAAVLTFAINHLIVRLKKYRRLKRIL